MCTHPLKPTHACMHPSAHSLLIPSLSLHLSGLEAINSWNWALANSFIQSLVERQNAWGPLMHTLTGRYRKWWMVAKTTPPPHFPLFSCVFNLHSLNLPSSLPPSPAGSHPLFISASLANYAVAPSEDNWRLQNAINIIICQCTPSQSRNCIVKPLPSLTPTVSKDTERDMQKEFLQLQSLLRTAEMILTQLHFKCS